MSRLSIIIAILVLQSVCAVFFVYDILGSVLGLRSTPINWQLREFIEIGASIGLVLGLVMGGLTIRNAWTRSRLAEEKLRLAASAFREVVEERFVGWSLTPAERDVALFSLKGFSTSEIAELRNTSEGTVKAQTAAIYRKAGVTGRPQLLALFIEDLMDDTLTAAAMPPSDSAGNLPAA